MKWLSLAPLALVMSMGCVGPEFTATGPADGDAGEVLQDAGAILVDEDGSDGKRAAVDARAKPAPSDAAGGDEHDQGDAGELADVEAPHDAAGDEDRRLICTASECPACPTLEKPCCNTQTLACGCYAPGIVCH